MIGLRSFWVFWFKALVFNVPFFKNIQILNVLVFKSTLCVNVLQSPATHKRFQMHYQSRLYALKMVCPKNGSSVYKI